VKFALFDGEPEIRAKKAPISGVKPKDLVGIPWAVAFALRDDGWWLRSEIIWHKLNPMPESVRDRPTRCHEQVFLLTKGDRYFYDADAISEPVSMTPGAQAWRRIFDPAKQAKETALKDVGTKGGNDGQRDRDATHRNARTIWAMASAPFHEAHFATFPEELPRRCILAGTSDHGACAACGAPWSRHVETERVADRPGRVQGRDGDTLDAAHGKDGRSGNRMSVRTTTTGWEPTCECPDRARVRPCIVLDPFTGSGTTLAVADAHQRAFVGIELNPEYAEMARRRVFRDGAPLFSGTM
jgi:hypothetical protein